MGKLNYAIVAVFILISAIFSQSVDTGLKTQAIHDIVSPIIQVDTITAYDNFIASDGNEYVVLTIDQTPSFLIRLERINSSYKAQFVRDGQQIENILTKRYSQIENQKKNISSINQIIKERILEFNESRFLHEAKYDLLFGINNSKCSTPDECRASCKTTEVCDYVLNKNGDTIISDILKYQTTKMELNALVEKITDPDELEFRSEVDTLTFYLDVIDKIVEQSQKMQNSDFVKQSYILYSGQIIYDIASVEDAQEQAQIALEPARAADEKARSIESIQKITALRVPPLSEQTQEDGYVSSPAQVELIENQSSPAANTNTTIQYADAYPPINQDISDEGNILTLENIVLFLSLLIVITTIVYVMYITKNYLQKEESQRFGMRRHGYHRGLMSDKKKKIENLEDLL